MKDTKISIFRDLLKAKDVPYFVTLEKAVERIRVGKSKDTVDLIRTFDHKKDRNEIKVKLPCILFAGQFKERNIKGLEEHSGLMNVDFDDYENETIMLEQFEILKQNPHIVVLFVSPSGNGYKGVVRIPKCDASKHVRYFKEFEKKFQYMNFDSGCSNVDRVCFESYDPNIYTNYDAVEYAPELIDKGYTVSERVPLIPVTDEDKIIEKIMNFNWNKGFSDGEKNNYIFDLAGAFCEYGVSQSTAESYLYNNIIAGSCKDEQGKIKTIKSAYRKRNFDTKYFEDYQTIEKIKDDLKNGKESVIKKFNISEDVFDEIKQEIEHEIFWNLSVDKNGKTNVSVDPFKYKNFLERNGFKKHYPDGSQKPNLVFIESNKVSVTSVEIIKDFVLDYLQNANEREVWNYCAKYQNLFSDQFLLILESIELNMLSDTREKSFIAFNNGVLEITKNKVSLIDYIDIDFYIWQENIIQRDFVVDKNNDNDYKKFIYNISNQTPLAVECAIGYLISTYKNRSNNKAIILNDETISENPEGGTGKGVFVQGISQIRKSSILDGKMFDGKKSFPYQTVSIDTKILVFDDVVKNFNFEEKFSLVTEGLTLERKNKDAIKLSVHDSPKLVISTNYAIRGEGNSHDRRRFELEIAQYYGREKTPEDEFGRQLFDDWDKDEFNRFDNYMVHCLQSFLTNGLIAQNAKNIKMRKFIAETSMEFWEFMEDQENIKHNERLGKKTIFDSFIENYPDYGKMLKRKRFNIWIQKYCSFKDFEYDSGTTQGFQWFEIKTELESFDKVVDNECPF